IVYNRLAGSASFSRPVPPALPSGNDGGGATVQPSDVPRAVQGAQLNQPSLVTLARDAIRAEILSGRLEPGARLVEERLKERFGVSRPPLREALRMLENDGLITIRPRRGAVVATMDEQDVYEVMTLRSGLERMAIEQGVPVCDASR